MSGCPSRRWHRAPEIGGPAVDVIAMPVWLSFSLALVALPVGLLGFVWFMIWMGKKDWSNPRRVRGGRASATGAIFSELQRLVEPQVTQVEEEKRQRHAIEEERAEGGAN